MTKIIIATYQVETKKFKAFNGKKYLELAPPALFDYIIENENYNVYVMQLNTESSIIFDYLLKNNFIWRQVSKNGAVKKGEFTAFIAKSIVFNIKVRLHNGKICKFYNVQKFMNCKKIEDFYKFYKKEEEKIKNKKSISSIAFETFKEENEFKHFTPYLKKEDFENIRKSYRGGLCEINDNYKNKIIDNVKLYDINSFYSSIMITEDMPVYRAYHWKTKSPPPFDTDKNLIIYHIYVDYKIQKNKVSIINNLNDFAFSKNSIKDTQGMMIDLWLTDIELEYMRNNYDIYEINFIECYIFSKINGSKIFGDYIKKYYNIKKQCTQKKDLEGKAIAKAQLEGLYGKYGSNNKYNLYRPILINDIITLKYDYTMETKGEYLPIAIYTTAYARVRLANIINKCYDKFIYCDTDSIATIGTHKDYNIKVSDKIGEFKVEFEADTAKFIKQKTYYMENAENKKVVVAGIPKDYTKDLSIENFTKNKKIEIKKIKKIQGGIEYEKSKVRL